MRLKGMIPIAGLSLFLGYLYKDISYYSEPPKQEYKQEFMAELGQFSESMKRSFPRNAKPIGTINITLYVDAEFKRNHDSWLDPTDNESWKMALEDSLEKAARRFYDDFKISFTVDDVRYWNPEEGQWLLMYGVLGNLLDMESESIGSIGITGMHMADRIAGISATTIENNRLELKAVIRDVKQMIIPQYENVPLENLIQHELSHWFGAQDSRGRLSSVMDYEYINEISEWDQANKTRMNREIQLILEYIELQKTLKTEPK